jgi:hypothetical protein
MPEPHHAIAVRDGLAHPLLRPIDGLYLDEHVQHRAGRAAVQRSFQRADAPVIADTISDWVEAMTRAVNVLAFMP